jgi:hypothetical protein
MKMWTDASIEFLFEQVARQFGPHRDWPSTQFPESRANYEDFLLSYAKTLGCSGRDAVHLQIQKALHRVDSQSVGDADWIRAKFFAKKAGFL